MSITKHQANSSNRDEEDTLQCLLQALASLQEKSEEQNVEGKEIWGRAIPKDMLNQFARRKFAHEKSGGKPTLYTPLKIKSAQILREVYHVHLLDMPQLTDKQIDPN
ncbi:hypothetical protein CR513_46455, partial [Mucuna pruriens]